MKKNKKLFTTLIPMCITLFLMILIYTGYILFFKDKNKEFLESIESSIYASVNFYSIYGIHLNLEGTITLEEDSKETSLVLTNGKTEITLPATFEKNGLTYHFKTSQNINEGINLETLPKGELFLLIKVKDSQEKIKYYSVENKTSYKDLDYYTITKNKKNNHINIEWNSEDICPTLKFTIQEASLPDEVYDITIDPGHDAFDSGAVVCVENNQILSSTSCNKENLYKESELNLKVSLALKEKLEEMGYKVAMTRDDFEDLVEVYEKGGSALLANETKSKFNLAIHHNASGTPGGDKYLNGLEVYVAAKIDFTLAKLLVKNITEEARTNTSSKTKYLSEDGIYQRYFTEEEIEMDDVQPSNKDTNTIYYYNIREVGGINTHATNDGRYIPEYPKNPFYDANQTAESYLLELGYIDNIEDLNNIENNREGYAYGIAKSIKEYLEKDF